MTYPSTIFPSAWVYGEFAEGFTNSFSVTNTTFGHQDYDILITYNPGETNETTFEDTYTLDPGEVWNYEIESDKEFDLLVTSSPLNPWSDTPTTTTTNVNTSGVSTGQSPIELITETFDDPDIYQNVNWDYGTQAPPSVVDGSRSSNGTNELNQLIVLEDNSEERHDDLKDLLVALDQNQAVRDQLNMLNRGEMTERLISALEGDLENNDATDLLSTGILGTNELGTLGGVASTNAWSSIVNTNNITIASNTAPIATIPFSELHPDLDDWDLDIASIDELDDIVSLIRALMLVFVTAMFMWQSIRTISGAGGLNVLIHSWTS